MPAPPDYQNPYRNVEQEPARAPVSLPTLAEQIEYQKNFCALVEREADRWPDEELRYARGILASLRRLVI